MTVLHFDLRVTVAADGSVTADLSPAGGFPTPAPETTHRVVEGIRVNGHPAQPGIPPGCSAPNGHYVGRDVIFTALDFGMPDSWKHGYALAAHQYEEFGGSQEWEYYDSWHDMVTEAEVWLNDHTEGGVWSWSDGDFRLDGVEDCPLCGEQRYSDPLMYYGVDDPCDGDHLSRWV